MPEIKVSNQVQVQVIYFKGENILTMAYQHKPSNVLLRVPHRSNSQRVYLICNNMGYGNQGSI